MDLFGQSLVGDLLDAPTSIPTEKPAMNSSSSGVDLFADATFVSATPHLEKGPGSQTQVRYYFISINGVIVICGALQILAIQIWCFHCIIMARRIMWNDSICRRIFSFLLYPDKKSMRNMRIRCYNQFLSHCI